MLAAVTRSPGEMVIEDVPGPGPARAGNVIVRPEAVGGAFPEKEIDVIGSSCATAEDFKNAIGLVSANRAPLAALFSHHFPLSRTKEAFQFAMSHPQDAIKTVVTVN